MERRGGEGSGEEASSFPNHTNVCKISRLYYGAISLLISNVSPAGKLGKFPALFSSVNGSSLTGLSQNLKKKTTTFEEFIHCSVFLPHKRQKSLAIIVNFGLKVKVANI